MTLVAPTVQSGAVRGSSARGELQLGFQGSSEGGMTTTELHSNTLASSRVPSSTFPGSLFQHCPWEITKAVTPPLSLKPRPEYL